jgi:flagellar biosynthesis chaperone FliJ
MKKHHKTLTGLLDMHKTRIDNLMEFNRKALDHIENLNHDINEIDKQQEEFEKQLASHKLKMN